MTITGESAGVEAHRQRSHARELHRQAEDAEQRAARFEIAHRTESEAARILAPLASIGYHLLADRRWPGSRTAQVDMVVVGRAGVFIVGTKAWREVAVHDDRITCSQEDVTDDIARLADLAYSTEAALADTGLAPDEVHAVAALAGQKRMHARVASVDVIGVNDLVGHITKRGARLSASRVDEVLAAMLHHFPVIGDQATPPPQVVVPAPVLPREPDALIPTIEPTNDGLTEQLLDGVLDALIEDWMAFLDPAQAKLVRRSFNGSARIRGAAGTGKTVVGLHRAAYLARATGGRVLFTTYITSSHSSSASRPAWSVASTSWAFATRLLKERVIAFRALDGRPGLPANKSFRCAYVAHQVAVKAKYALSVAPAERYAIAWILTTCATQPLPTESSIDAPSVVPTATASPSAKPEQTDEPAAVATGAAPASGSISYANCDAVPAAGTAPIRAGDPGYSPSWTARWWRRRVRSGDRSSSSSSR